MSFRIFIGVSPGSFAFFLGGAVSGKGEELTVEWKRLIWKYLFWTIACGR
ncbi:hypothetical protein DsansV1_C03g0028931 [Dioscorea sansibarensis]